MNIFYSIPIQISRESVRFLKKKILQNKPFVWRSIFRWLRHGFLLVVLKTSYWIWQSTIQLLHVLDLENLGNTERLNFEEFFISLRHVFEVVFVFSPSPTRYTVLPQVEFIICTTLMMILNHLGNSQLSRFCSEVAKEMHLCCCPPAA